MNAIGRSLGKTALNPVATGPQAQAASEQDQAVQAALDETKNMLGGGPNTPAGLSKALGGENAIPGMPGEADVAAVPGKITQLDNQIGDLLSQTSKTLGNKYYSANDVVGSVMDDLENNVQGFSDYAGPNGDLNHDVAVKALTKDLQDQIKSAILHPTETGVEPNSLDAIDSARTIIGKWAQAHGSFNAGSGSASAERALIQDIGAEAKDSLKNLVGSEVKSAGLNGYEGLVNEQHLLMDVNDTITGKATGGIRPFSPKSAAFRLSFPSMLLGGARTAQNPLIQALATLKASQALTGAQ
jgi:hypothetical protein